MAFSPLVQNYYLQIFLLLTAKLRVRLTRAFRILQENQKILLGELKEISVSAGETQTGANK